MVPYQIISTGSQGNAVIINKHILVDCGVPYKAIEPYIKQIKLVLLTHIHSDHFRKSTIRRISAERPTVRFGACRWMVKPLMDAGVPSSQIDPLVPGTMYGYGICNIIPFLLVHDVPNCGYKIHFPIGKVFYATDTGNLNGIKAPRYDLYLIEANHLTDEIQEKISIKEAAGEFAYEKRTARFHLSKEKCDDFIYRNMYSRSEYAYLHIHEDDGDDT